MFDIYRRLLIYTYLDGVCPMCKRAMAVTLQYVKSIYYTKPGVSQSQFAIVTTNLILPISLMNTIHFINTNIFTLKCL